MKIGITNDHYGINKKKQIISYLEKMGHEVIDYGYNGDETNKVDYPIYAFKMCENKNEYDIGILICTSGIGMSIAANKVKGIRCARICNSKEAIISRVHNHANCIAVSGEYSLIKLKKIINNFINTKYDNTERYSKRTKMIDEY